MMQSSSSLSIEHVCARVTWHMARNHGWGKWTPTEVILNNGLTNEEKPFAEENLLPKFRSGKVPFMQYREDALRLNGEKRRQIAYYLRDVGGYTKIQIEATVSRFDGFGSTEKPDINYFDN